VGDRLKGRVAIVTGGGRGIGRAEALLLAEEGASVVVNDLGCDNAGRSSSREPADSVVEDIRKRGGKAVASYDNVAEMTTGERLVKQAVDSFGRLDILVNNAGVLRDRMIFNMSEEEWDTVIAYHLKGHFTTSKYACIAFRQQRSGRIVNTSSESGMGNLGQANYAAAKEGIVGLTRTVARDMGRYGVTCNAIRPRAATRLTMTEELRQAMERARAVGVAPVAGGLGTHNLPEAVAPMVVWLCTDVASNVNGRTFIVGGGMIALCSEITQERTIYKRENNGVWKLDELDKITPASLADGLVNQWPVLAPSEKR